MKDFQRWLNKHLVSMVLMYWHLDEKGNPKDQSFLVACSGFVMTFGDMWFLMTAGHVLEDLDELIANKSVKVVNSFLLDYLGSQATHRNSIPFSYEADKRDYVHEDGLDFGLISLSPNDRRLLEANGIAPVTIENWINQDLDRCEAFALVGIPFDWVSKPGDDCTDGIKIGTLLTSVKRLIKPPEGADETKYERFMGDLGKTVDLPHGLEGTSGGPIIGFFKDDEGNWRYWIVALQSSCLAKRYIFGCPVKFVGQILLHQLRQSVDATEQ